MGAIDGLIISPTSFKLVPCIGRDRAWTNQVEKAIPGGLLPSSFQILFHSLGSKRGDRDSFVVRVCFNLGPTSSGIWTVILMENLLQRICVCEHDIPWRVKTMPFLIYSTRIRGES